jgi:hypothetical protein
MSREDDARRALDRLDREREKFFHGVPDVASDDGDPSEKLGKRIASILRYVMLFGLVVYFAVTLMT